MANATLGDRVRVYDKDDWFFEGTVTDIIDQEVHVDFGDWIQSYPQDSFGITWDFYEPVIIARCEGTLVKNFSLTS